MVLLREISFSVYLVHVTVFWFYLNYWQTSREVDYCGFAICVAATLALSFLVWAAVEVPTLNAAKKWLRGHVPIEKEALRLTQH